MSETGESRQMKTQGQQYRGQRAFVAASFAAIAISSPAHALDAGQALQTAADVSAKTAQLIQMLISQGYQAAPALMLGLALAVAIPVVAVASRVAARANLGAGATRRDRRLLSGDVTDEITGEAVEIPETSGRAFLEVVGESAGSSCARYAILRDMLRIGREDDNDIRIPSGAVHRYHAAIHREDLDDWRITDLSGVDGNGITVNGQRCSDARLHDGDVIELGPGRLRFRASFA